ncbi:MAG: 5-(carboxyamino)imidazole ribonucleotide mutase [Blastocatellia bacterium]|jgi:5-(carboxyamino)imidazole ribonucleotide mutase|nr:5-(carboxyamino)imidazole ribonucleotide mutase [Blastocatellia bacterium]
MATRKKKTDAATRRRGDAAKKKAVTAAPRLQDVDAASRLRASASHLGASASESLAASPRPRVSASPLVAVIMGSKSDWETMRQASEMLTEFEVAHECRVVSAHRTPLWMAEFAATAEARGLEVIIAGAGGAAHLPGMVAAQTIVPVLGVPIESRALKGLDSLLSIAQMPAGVPVGTLAIGQAGAKNAALLAVAILATTRPNLRRKLHRFRRQQEQQVREAQLV